jgi:hypothetical protein
MTVTLDSACELHPQVALRPEPFGALAYHYGNRKLVFLKHPETSLQYFVMLQHTTHSLTPWLRTMLRQSVGIHL